MASLDRIRVLIRVLASSQTTLTLATTGADGAARATPLFYLSTSDLLFYWFSAQSSAHSRDCVRSRQVAVAIHSAAQSWQQIRGVQMTGRVAIVQDRAHRQSIRRAFVERFQLEGALRVALQRSTLYCFTPEWIRCIDNSRRFGDKWEMFLEQRPEPPAG